MKRSLFYLVIAALVTFAACKKETTTPITPVVVNGNKVDSLVAGSTQLNYPNDVYYSLKTGVVKIAPHAEWDLAFATIQMSISILINTSNGDSLFIWKGGAIADFNKAESLDNNITLTTNFDTTSWYNFSAFEQNFAANNPYDVGWGIYNGTTHDVIGDSVYILKLANGTYKKLAIIARYASNSNFVFKIADLAKDAKADSVIIQANNYPTKNFIYYSAVTKTIIDREPAKNTWDFEFTRFNPRIPGYPISTVILTNEGIATSKLALADTTKTYNQVKYTKKVDGIGSNWKHFNNTTYVYDIVNPYYYIHASDSSYYRIKFKSFKSSTGVTVFEKKKLN